jgi:hypothetical protein
VPITTATDAKATTRAPTASATAAARGETAGVRPLFYLFLFISFFSFFYGPTTTATTDAKATTRAPTAAPTVSAATATREETAGVRPPHPLVYYRMETTMPTTPHRPPTVQRNRALPAWF